MPESRPLWHEIVRAARFRDCDAAWAGWRKPYGGLADTVPEARCKDGHPYRQLIMGCLLHIPSYLGLRGIMVLAPLVIGHAYHAARKMSGDHVICMFGGRVQGPRREGPRTAVPDLCRGRRCILARTLPSLSTVLAGPSLYGFSKTPPSSSAMRGIRRRGVLNGYVCTHATAGRQPSDRQRSPRRMNPIRRSCPSATRQVHNSLGRRLGGVKEERFL